MEQMAVAQSEYLLALPATLASSLREVFSQLVLVYLT
jgi:hypothetical protein